VSTRVRMSRMHACRGCSAAAAGSSHLQRIVCLDHRFCTNCSRTHPCSCSHL
jgi:hypothetical protein